MTSSLTNWDPFGEIDSLHERMTRLFNDGLGAQGHGLRVPLTDIYEQDGALVIETALPSFTEEEIEVSLQGGRLEVRAEHNDASESRKRTYLRRETSAASYYRVFQLPESVDADKAEASFEDGVLRVRLPQHEAVAPKRLQLSKGRQSIAAESRDA